MAILKALSGKRSPVSIQQYVLQEKKTNSDLVKGYEVDGMDFGRQFERMQTLFEKTSGRRYYHYILSLTPEETRTISPEKVNALGYRLAEQTFGNQGYQFAVVTHTDTNHIHDHIIVNAVNFNTGRKLHMTPRDLQAMKEQLNLLCRSHGLEAIPDSGKKIADGEYWAKQHGKDPWKQELRDVIALVGTQAKTYEEFKNTLKYDWNIEITRDTGKGMTYVHPSGKKVRGKKLGIVYDKPHLMAAFEKEQEVQKPRRKVIARHNVPAVSKHGVHKKHSNHSSLEKIVQHTVQNGDTAYQTGELKNADRDQNKDELERVEKEIYSGWSL